MASTEATNDINSAFTPALPDPSPIPSPQTVAGCYTDRYQQPDAVITKKVDLLFLTDTSGSLDDERLKVAQGVTAFIQALPSDVDYRVATMLAHGGDSQYAGRIYSYQRTGTAKVLRSDQLTSAQIQTELQKDLTHVKVDNNADGGEIGTYSLTRAMDDDLMTESKNLGFFRDDAALAVIMISDENDICAVFPAGVTPVPDPEGSEARAKTKYCTRAAPAHVVNGVTMTPAYTEHITAKSVVDKLYNLQGGRPLVLASITYIDPAKTPRVGENEVGYGWIDMVNLAGGVKVDIGDASYQSGLSQIGALTSVKLSLQKEFSLTHSASDIDLSTLAVKVDGAPVTFTYISDLNQVSLDTLGSARSTVDVSYCEPLPSPTPSPTPSPSPSPTGVPGVDSICSTGTYAPKSVVRAGLAIDPAEGSMNAIIAGLTPIVGAAPTVYSEAQVASGQLLTDGVTVLFLSRKVVVSATTAGFVQGVKNFIAAGGSIIAEYDGAAMFFQGFTNVTVAFTGHFSPSLGLFAGNVQGGGLLIPTSFSSAFVVDPTHPIWLGLPTQLDTGLRAAFAVSDYPSTWLKPIASFTASGTSGGMAAGSYPAALVGRCGAGRIVLLPMNHFTVLTNTNVQTLVTNSLNWVVGQ